jgi:hypothetical protein
VDRAENQGAGSVRALPVTSPPLVVALTAAQSDWHGRVLTDSANRFAVIVGGNWNGSGSAVAASVGLSVSGLQLCCGGVSAAAYYTDANLTRLWKRITIAADGSETATGNETETGTGNRLVNGLKLVVPSAFGATFFPTRAAPALVIAPLLQPPANASDTPAWSGLSLGNIPWPLHWDLSANGSYVDIGIELFAPWRSNTECLLRRISCNLLDENRECCGTAGAIAFVSRIQRLIIAHYKNLDVATHFAVI